MKTPEYVTLAIAILGAVLGIINTWQTLDRDRVKLRVSMRLAFPLSQERGSEYRPFLAIEVINQSPFELTIAQLGVRQNGPPWDLLLITPLMLDGVTLPRRMEARSSFTAYFPLDSVSMDFLDNVTRAYAKTDADRKVYSGRRESANAMRQVRSFIPRDREAHGD